MNYITNEIEFNKAIDALSIKTEDLLGGKTPITILHDIGGEISLTLNEIGEICELVRQIITKECLPKDFEAGLTEKIDEDNKEKIPQVVSLISERIFSKLLPALGIKIPIELSLQTAPPRVEGLEIVDSALQQTPPSRLPPKRVAPPPPSSSWGQTTVPPPIVRGATFSSTYAPPPSNLPTGESDSRFSGTKPPIMETSHAQMSDKPIESLLRMLDGRVSEKEMLQQYEKLPLKLKEALRSVDSAKKVVDVGRKYALHVDKIGELGAETGMVILGFTHPGQFLSRLSKRLGLPEEKVKLIGQEINTEVFLRIREALKQIHEETVPAIPSSPIPIKPAVQAASIRPAQNLGDSDNNEVPDRATILHDIENPKPLWFRDNKVAQANIPTVPTSGPSLPIPVKPAVTQTSTTSVPTQSPSQPSAAGEEKLGDQAQDTPWQPGTLPKPPEPVIQREVLGQKLDSLRSVPPPVMSGKPMTSAPIMSPKIATPTTQTVAPKPVSTATPMPSPSQLSSSNAGKLGGQASSNAKNILDQKLSGTVTSGTPKINTSSDPYRESF